MRIAVMLLLAWGGLQQTQPPAQPPTPAPAATAAPRRAHVVTRLEGFELTDTAKMDKQTTLAGASRGLPAPVPSAPHLAKLYSQNPVLQWTWDGSADARFLARVYNEDEESIHEATVDGRSYTYQGAPLKAGRTYYWTVEHAGQPDSRSPMIGMKVVDSSERAAIATEMQALAAGDAAGRLARAKVFIARRLWYDALTECDAAIAADPRRAEAYEQRGQLFAQFPSFQRLADADFAKADALAGAAGR
jgi:hypothetical protein